MRLAARHCRVFALAFLIVLTGCSSSGHVKPAPLVDFESSATVEVRWRADIGKGGEYVFTPAVVGQTAYVAARDGQVARLDNNGHEVWRVDVGQQLSGGVGANSKLVVVGTPKAEVIALDAATGAPLWRATASSEVLAAPTIDDDLVIVRCGDSHIFAFAAEDGKRRWVYQRTTPTLTLRSDVGVLAVSKREIVAGFPGGRMVSIATNNGAALWEATVTLPKGSTELERIADVAGPPVIEGRQICAVAYQGRVSCFDLMSGGAQWSKDMSSDVGLAIDDRNVYVTDEHGGVHALDRSNGTSIWKQDKLANRHVSRPLALGELVAVADGQGYVHLLRRDTGAFAGRIATDGSAIAAALQHFGKGLIVQTKAGDVFALDVK